MKNCIFFSFFSFTSEFIHPSGPIILVPIKKCLFQLVQFPVYMIFFQGTLFNFFYKPFSMSEFAGFKTFVSIRKNKLASNRFCSANWCEGGGQGLGGMSGLEIFFYVFLRGTINNVQERRHLSGIRFRRGPSLHVSRRGQPGSVG